MDMSGPTYGPAIHSSHDQDMTKSFLSYGLDENTKAISEGVKAIKGAITKVNNAHSYVSYILEKSFNSTYYCNFRDLLHKITSRTIFDPV